jgi:hypothetical protein
MSRFSLALMGIIVLQSFSMGVSGRAEAVATYYIADQCYLPGPDDNAGACTVNWGWSGNPPNNVLCLWTTTNDLYASGGSGSCDALNVRTDYSKLQYFPNIIASDASFNNNEPACSDD